MDHITLTSNIFLLLSSTKVISRRKLLNLTNTFLVSLLLWQEQYNHSTIGKSKDMVTFEEKKTCGLEISHNKRLRL